MEKSSNPCEMEYKFYLVFVKHTAIEDESTTPATAAARQETDIPKIYLRVESLIEFDTFTATHGPGTIVDGRHALLTIFGFGQQIICFFL